MKNEWRAGHDNTYSIVLNSAIEDCRITAVAFRVLAYLAGKPDGWDIYNADVAKKCSISQKRLSKAWKELEDAGWIIRKKSTNNNDIGSKCGTYKYTLVDPSQASKCDTEVNNQERRNIPQSIKTLKERSNNNQHHPAQKNDKKKSYGTADNVMLTDDEYGKLKTKLAVNLESYIDRLSTYDKVGRYRNHYLTILRWWNKDKERNVNQPIKKSMMSPESLGIELPKRVVNPPDVKTDDFVDIFTQ
jgi:predicted transcriptional regulator